MATSKNKTRGGVAAAFVECNEVLKRLLTRYFTEPQDINDVAQEAFLRAYVAEQTRKIEQPRAYLVRVARNLALTKLTEKSRQITDYIEDMTAKALVDDESAVDSQLEAEQMFGLYCEAVVRLPEKMRHVYLLRKVHGLSHKEIAERLSLSVSSVEKYLLRGILICREHVRENSEVDPNRTLSKSRRAAAGRDRR